jgi:hypothetical protein
VDISINGQHHGQARHVKGPLYVLEWNPSKFSEGLHDLSVSALVRTVAAADHQITVCSSWFFVPRSVDAISLIFSFSPLNPGHFYEFRKFIKISPVGIAK